MDEVTDQEIIEDDPVKVRLNKRAALLDAGEEAYARTWDVTAHVDELESRYESLEDGVTGEDTYRVAGRIMAIRNQGKAGTAGAVRGAAHAVPDARRRAPRPAFCIAGNDIAADVVSNYLGGAGMPMRRVYENSYRALADMYRGEVEAALVHLYDHRTDSYNVPYVQRLVPGTPVVVIRVVARRQGFLVARGNPKGLRRWVDLLRADVTMVNREKGAGTRILLDEQLVALEAGVKRPAGYDRELTSPLALGAFIANGGADVGVGSERVFHQVDGLDFLPLQDEYLDLVLLKQERTAEVIGFIRRVLSSAGFRDELGSIVGYDTDDTGKVLYEV